MTAKTRTRSAASLQGRPLSTTAPVAGQAPIWDGTSYTPATPGGPGSATTPGIDGFRLTAQTGTPLPTTDRTAVGTIYLTPAAGNVIAIYDGANWIARQTAEVSLALVVTSGKNYDVFAYWTGSAVALELSAAWTTDTARADALTTQDGVIVKSGALTRRYVGTIRASAANQTEDSNAKRFVYSWSNRAARTTIQSDTTATWSIAASAGIAPYNSGDADWKHELVVGGLVDADAVEASAQSRTALVTVLSAPKVGIGLDSTSAFASASLPVQRETPSLYASHQASSFVGLVGIGYHYLQALAQEVSGAGGVNFFANATGDSLTTRSVR